MARMVLSLFVGFLLVLMSFPLQGEQLDENVVSQDSTEGKMFGIDANYVLELEDLLFRTWRDGFCSVDPYTFFSECGVDSFRLRLFANESGPYGLENATKTALRAQDAGMEVYVVLFLSDGWSDVGNQPAPQEWVEEYDWSNLSLVERSAIVYNYSFATVSYLLDMGIDAELYEIGNEIDFGICGVFESDSSLREDVEYMSEEVWDEMAVLINAAVEGVQDADPTSEFMLHIAHWWDLEFSIAFFECMMGEGIPLEYFGLSFYPSSGLYNLTEMMLYGKGNGTRSHILFEETVAGLADTLEKQVVVCEYAYPSSSIIFGEFSWFNHPVEGYPLTRSGQKVWLADFLEYCFLDEDIAGFFYFSPEFFLYIWSPMSLFSFFGFAKPAVEVFHS